MTTGVYKVTEELAKELNKGYDIDLFAMHLVNEIDKVDDEMSKLEPYNYKYKELQIRKNTLQEVREKYYNLQKINCIIICDRNITQSPPFQR